MKIKSIQEINEKIKKGKAVIVTAEEIRAVSDISASKVLQTIDVVTTATFAPMCSSGIFINFGHSTPGIRMEKLHLNNVPLYGGIAAVDAYLGATAESFDNKNYGGAHVIEALVKGEDLFLEAWGKGTDCYPRQHVKTIINKNTVNEIIMCNPRNAYQNYPVAVNSTKDTLYTYMGTLQPEFGNATYATSGIYSPLLNDPYLNSVGIGTRILLCGTQGYVVWNGTQHNTSRKRNKFGIPLSNAATLTVIGDVKTMDSRFLKASYFKNYGVSLFVGIGIPIPVLNEETACHLIHPLKEISTTVFDYGTEGHPAISTTNYKDLFSGHITVDGKQIRTSPLSSLKKAKEIAHILKKDIQGKRFFLSEPVQLLPKNTKTANLVEKEEFEYIDHGIKHTFSANTKKTGISLCIDSKTCIHCGICISSCNNNALKLNTITSELEFDENLCTKCDCCINGCPINAISYICSKIKVTK